MGEYDMYNPNKKGEINILNMIVYGLVALVIIMVLFGIIQLKLTGTIPNINLNLTQ